MTTPATGSAKMIVTHAMVAAGSFLSRKTTVAATRKSKM
jgi:hypothetical protein